MKKNVIRIAILIIVLAITTGIIIFLNNDKAKEINKFSLDSEYYQNGDLELTDAKTVNKLITDKKSFMIFTYNNYCQFSTPCDEIFLKGAKDLNITILKLPIDEFKKTSLAKTVKYAPSVVLVNKGKIVKYLDAESDKDVNLYQDSDLFINWVKDYINLK